MPVMTHKQRRERLEKVLADLKSGMSTSDAATKYGLTESYVTNLRYSKKPTSKKKAKVPTSRTSAGMTHEERRERREEIRKELKAGAAVRDLAEKYGLTENYIYGLITNDVAAKRPKRARLMLLMAEVIRTAKNFSEISRSLHVSRQYVSAVARQMRKAGIPFPTRAEP